MASISDLDENSRAALKYNGREGVVVTGVFPDSPAQNAGIAAGDIITEIDGQKIKDSGQLRKYVMSCKAGQDISIVVLREGVRNNLKASLAERPDNLEM
ncbi:MAG: PDZ domain-containing protein [Chloroflexi bacterium]|nr:PDZ domain-containing protein [Chloroflexota bacterium]